MPMRETSLPESTGMKLLVEDYCWQLYLVEAEVNGERRKILVADVHVDGDFHILRGVVQDTMGETVVGYSPLKMAECGPGHLEFWWHKDKDTCTQAPNVTVGPWLRTPSRWADKDARTDVRALSPFYHRYERHSTYGKIQHDRLDLSPWVTDRVAAYLGRCEAESLHLEHVTLEWDEAVCNWRIQFYWNGQKTPKSGGFLMNYFPVAGIPREQAEEIVQQIRDGLCAKGVLEVPPKEV